MKNSILAALLLCAASAACAQTLEYRRPTADANSTNAALRFPACNGGATNQSSADNGAVYIGKSGAGPTGSSANQSASKNSNGSVYKMRVFTTWQTTTNTYSVLTLSGSFKCSVIDGGGSNGGGCGAAYSTDGGSTWTQMYTYFNPDTGGDAQTTYTATITGTALSGVQIGICATAFGVDGQGDQTATITTYDIWTTGTTSGPTTGYVIPPQIISKLHNPVRGYSR